MNSLDLFLILPLCSMTDDSIAIYLYVPFYKLQLSCVLCQLAIATYIMSRIFESQNQFVIRFPQSVASMIEEYLDNPDGVEMPLVELELDRERKDVSQRIALKVAVNDEKFKATVMDLPTISSTFKTIDRINFFKSNDISELIVVHQNEEDSDNIYQDMAEKIMDKEERKVLKYKCESGITTPTRYIRQQNFKEKPDIDRGKIAEVDREMEKIRYVNSQVKQKEKQQAKEKKEKMGIK